MGKIMQVLSYIHTALTLLLIPFIVALIIYCSVIPIGGVKYFFSENDFHSLIVILTVVFLSVGLRAWSEIDRKRNGDSKLKNE